MQFEFAKNRDREGKNCLLKAPNLIQRKKILPTISRSGDDKNKPFITTHLLFKLKTEKKRQSFYQILFSLSNRNHFY